MSENKKLSMEELGRLNPEEFKSSEKTPLVFLLDDVRSMNNVGSVFRSADAFLIEGIELCGITPCPPHREIQKTALGATETVRWQHHDNAVHAVLELKAQGFVILCAEQVSNSVMLTSAKFTADKKYVVILGNEVDGVNQQLVDLADYCLEIPQSGTKHSLNISVAAGIIAWEVYRQVSQ